MNDALKADINNESLNNRLNLINAYYAFPDTVFEYNGHHYNFYKNVCSSWEDAVEFCEELEGHLAIINNKEENKILGDALKKAGYDFAYFGLTDKEEEGVWLYVDDTFPTYENWGEGEPNNELNEDYALIYNDYYWNDADFGRGAVFICEWDF